MRRDEASWPRSRALIEAAICVLVMMTIAGQSARAMETYPTPDGGLMHVHLRFEGSMPRDGSPHCGEGFYFTHHGPGNLNVIRASVEPLGLHTTVDGNGDTVPRRLASVSGPTVSYPIVFSFDGQMQHNVPMVIDDWDITVDIEQRPTFDLGPGSHGAVRERRVQVNTGQLMADPQAARPAMPGFRASYRFDVPMDQHWIDSAITGFTVSVKPRAQIIAADSRANACPKTRALPEETSENGKTVPRPDYQVRTRSDAIRQITPYLLPVALIGKPPGDKSWAKLTVEAGASASLTLWEGQSTHVDTKETLGLGPITFSSSHTFSEREAGWGTTQLLGATNAVWCSSNRPSQTSPHGVGGGDLLFALIRPTVNTYETRLDRDFEVHPKSAPALACLPMQAFVTPGLSQVADQLTPAERQGIAALDPLLGDPHRPLTEPRFLLVETWFCGSGARCGGASTTYSLQKQVLRNRIANGKIEDNSSSLTFPIGAIAKAVGLPVPGGLDIGHRREETITTTVEMSNLTTLETVGTNVLEYVIDDSDDTRELAVEVYFDTYFRSYLFRDATMSVEDWYTRALMKWLFASVPRAEFAVVFVPIPYEDLSEEEAEWAEERKRGRHDVLGGLGDVIEKLGLEPESVDEVSFRGIEGSGVVYKTKVHPETRNVFIPNMDPGRYQLVLAGHTFDLILSEEGDVKFGWVGFHEPDADLDGVPDEEDVCPHDWNPEQEKSACVQRTSSPWMVETEQEDEEASAKR